MLDVLQFKELIKNKDFGAFVLNKEKNIQPNLGLLNNRFDNTINAFDLIRAKTLSQKYAAKITMYFIRHAEITNLSYSTDHDCLSKQPLYADNALSVINVMFFPPVVKFSHILMGNQYL